MKNLKNIFFVLALSIAVQVNAQQDPHFSLYKYNMNVINPAVAGTGEGMEFLASVRSQWINVPDAPETQNFNFNTPVGERVGLGFSVIRDNVFVLNETHVYADFSYKLQVGEKSDLFLGIKAGGSFVDISLSRLGITDDPLFSENINTFNPNVGVGAYLKGTNYYITASAPALLSGDRYEKQGLVPVEAVDNVHLFLGGGYSFELGSKWDLKPSVLGKVVNGAPLSLDLTTALMFNDRLEFGANYRLDECVTGFFTVQFLDNRFQLGYAYESTTSEIRDVNDGSHELIFRIMLDKKKN